MEQSKRVSIIIAVWNQLAYTKLAIDSVLKNTRPSLFELVIIDNGSKPDVKAHFDSLKDKVEVNYIRNGENLGSIRAMNQGASAARYEYLAFMHNDVVILENGWLDKMISFIDKDPKIGIAGLAGRTGCRREKIA